MGDKFVVVDVTAPQATTPPVVVDWRKCVLCQTETKEKLTDPKNNPRGGAGESYNNLEKALNEFFDLGQLPSLPFKVPYDELKIEGIAESLMKNGGVWHKSCYRELRSSRLERARKRSQKDVEVESPPQKQSPMKTRRTSTAFSRSTCIFCTRPGDNTDRLHAIQKKELGQRIWQYATDLQDRRLIARLVGAEDLLALKAAYHTACYAQFARKRSAWEKSQERKNSETPNAEFNQMSEYVLAGIIAYIREINETTESSHSPVFKLVDLMKMHDEGMREFGFSCQSHSVRFKDRLQKLCPELEACGEGKGQSILMAFRKDMANAVRSACRSYHREGLEFSAVVTTVRKDIFSHSQCDWEEISLDTQKACVPNSLKALIRMLLRGPTCDEREEGDGLDQAVSTIAQLIFFNAAKKKEAKDNAAEYRRYNRDRETPVPVYLALKIYSETRDKKLIQLTNKLGLSISYDRVKAIVRDKANEVCDRYRTDGAMCPPKFVKGIFLTAAADNIDHNLTSGTAMGSFHGTAMSLVQHPLPGEQGVQRGRCQTVKRQKVASLPDEYVIVQPCSLNVKAAKCPSGQPSTIQVETQASLLNRESQWLEQSSCEPHVPWASFHSQEKPETSDVQLEEVTVTPTALLPILPETAHSLATMFHCMKIVTSCTEFLNPGQTPVMTVDQPLYALCKQIQLLSPEMFGEKKFFLLLGGLHIELAALRAVGQWLEGSGWADLLVQAEVTTSGRAESILKASHIIRSRYAHEVSAAVLYSLLREAFETSLLEDCDSVDFETWRGEQSKYPHFKYWNTVLDLELLILQLVRAIRSADFTLYQESLVRLLPWFFILDHVNYARWLSVHVRDLINVGTNAPDVADRFKQGQFVAKKTSRKFSAMALDQCHEQLNAEIKGRGGLVGLTENPEALRKWMLGSPEIVSMVANYEQIVFDKHTDEDSTHHSDSPFYKKRFADHFKSLLSTFVTQGNPFLEDSDDLYNISTKAVASGDVVSTILHAEELGRSQYLDFVRERLEGSSKLLMDPIKANRARLFSSPPRKNQDKVQAKMAGLKSDRNLFSRLYIACQTRDGDLEDFFSHENQPRPPALSDDIGDMRSCTKSDLVKCLTELHNESVSDSMPQVEAKIIDGAAVVNFLTPSASLKTFKDYAASTFCPFIRSQCCHGVKRIDVVWDRYLPDSLKTKTREKRGKGVRMKVSLETTLPRSWPNFLRDSCNKDALFTLLAERVVQEAWNGVKVVSTHGSDVLSNSADENTSLCPCNHEEADTRMMLHLSDAVAEGHKKVLIRTGDTDVLVIAISVVQAIPTLEEVWLQLGAGGNHKFVSAHAIAYSLGPSRAAALPVFHAFTGCDTVSAFYGRGKKSAFGAWNDCPEVTEAFLNLTTKNYDELRDLVEKFVVKLYDKSSDAHSVNSCRRYLFTKKNRDICSIPPTSEALKQHALRAAFQGGFIWGSSLKVYRFGPTRLSSHCRTHLPGVGFVLLRTKTGFLDGQQNHQPKRRVFSSSNADAKKGCIESRCQCLKQNMPCSPLCLCDGCVE